MDRSVTEHVERVARALCRTEYEFSATPPAEPLDSYVEANWRRHVESARVQIEAMDEPTDTLDDEGFAKTIWRSLR